MNAIDRINRQQNAARDFRILARHLGLPLSKLAEGPFRLRSDWPKGLERDVRTLEFWVEGRYLPAGKSLVIVERFVKEAVTVLRRRKVLGPKAEPSSLEPKA